MAYKNVILGNIYTIIRPDLFTNRNYESPNSSLSDISPQTGFDYHQKSQTVFDDGNFKIQSSYSNNSLTINFYHDNNSVGYVTFSDNNTFNYIYLGFGIDAQASQKVSIVRVLSFTYDGRLYVKSYTDGDGDVPMINTVDVNGLYNALKDYPTYPWETSNGGGATHIAKRTGQLKDLSSYTSDILIVSGGGGGGLLVGENAYAGADAGGISGSGSNLGNQSTGYAFGQGESGTDKPCGGGGLYGGYKSNN